MMDRYAGWSSRNIEDLLQLNRELGFIDGELKKEFDRRCTEALDEVLGAIYILHPKVVYSGLRRTSVVQEQLFDLESEGRSTGGVG